MLSDARVPACFCKDRDRPYRHSGQSDRNGFDGRSIVSNRFGGILIQSENNLIGGSVAAARNELPATGNRISLSTTNARYNRVLGNFHRRGHHRNQCSGERTGDLSEFGHRTQIGGTSLGERNVISGNQNEGIYLQGPAWGNVIEGNRIGTDLGATLNLGNGGIGISMSSSYSNRIGTVANPNYIGFNGSYGCYLLNTTGIVIRANYIGNNGVYTPAE